MLGLHREAIGLQPKQHLAVFTLKTRQLATTAPRGTVPASAAGSTASIRRSTTYSARPERGAKAFTAQLCSVSNILRLPRLLAQDSDHRAHPADSNLSSPGQRSICLGGFSPTRH